MEVVLEISGTNHLAKFSGFVLVSWEKPVIVCVLWSVDEQINLSHNV